jgi:hypothetical protein
MLGRWGTCDHVLDVELVDLHAQASIHRFEVVDFDEACTRKVAIRLLGKGQPR